MVLIQAVVAPRALPLIVPDMPSHGMDAQGSDADQLLHMAEAYALVRERPSRFER